MERVAELAALLNPVAANWFLFLVQLGVSPDTVNELWLEAVGQPSPAKYCLSKGLIHWVNSDDNPTYEKIIDVFSGRVVPNRPLAEALWQFKQTVENGMCGCIRVCSAHGSVWPGTSSHTSLSLSGATHSNQSSVPPSSPDCPTNHVYQNNDCSQAASSHQLPGVDLEALSRFDPSLDVPSYLHPPQHSVPAGYHQMHSAGYQTCPPYMYFPGATFPGLQTPSCISGHQETTPLQGPNQSSHFSSHHPPPSSQHLSAPQATPLLPSHRQQSLPHASTTDDVIAGYADQMRGYYRTAIPQCFSITWPPPPTRKVFNLSMISHKQYNYGRGNDELVRLLHLGNIEEIVAKKSNVELKNLFHLDKAERKVVLIEGAPGAGKSTLAWHICQKWKSGELFQEFKLVVFVQLRDPAIQSAKSLADLFPAQLKSVAREVVSRMETKGGEGLFFVLDGWDEFPPGLRGNELIKNLICYPSAIAMPSSTLLITSRPIASGDLHQYASSRVETIGFKQAELNLYFKEALENDSKRVQELHDCLKQRPLIKTSCYLPLNTVIVVHLFLSLDNRLPNTLHGVFLQLVIHCIVRHIMKQQDDDSEPPHISSLDDLPPDMQTQLSNICAMAYHGVMKNKVTFSEDDLKSFNLPPDISTLSLIQVVVSFMPYRSLSYNFLHLSVQELLTAYHISKLPPEEQVKIFMELFGEPRFAAVFQYYAAFTKLQTAGIQDIMVSVIEQKDKTLLLTLLHCLYEAQDSSLCQFVASELKGKLDLSDSSLSPVDCIAVGYFLHQCANVHPMTAKLSKCSLDSYKLELLVKELKRPIQAVQFEVYIYLISNRFDGNQTRLIATELIASASEGVSIISKLNLSDNPIQDGEDGLSHLCQALTTNTSLLELNLSNCKLTITEENGQALSHMLKTNKTLKSLKISPLVNTNGRGVRYLSEGISSSSAISKLDLSCNPIQDGEDGLSHLCQALTTNTSLVELNLSNCKLHKACGPALRHMLETNKTLMSLNLTRNLTISDRSVAGIAEGLRSNHSLKRLDLRLCGIHDTGMNSLTDCLMVNHSLKELNLSGSPISPEAARGFSDMLKQNSTLKKLDVTQCALTDEAVKPLASALEVNSSLQELDLSLNYDLTDTALVALGESLKRNTRLKILRIGSHTDRTTADGWRQFVQCLKDNNYLKLLRTPHRALDVEDVNTVRRANDLRRLRHERTNLVV